MQHIDQYEELYRAYIGEKKQDQYFEKMHKGGFSWLVFFLNDIVFITRKMFVEATILIILIYLIGTVLEIIGVPPIAYNVIYLVFCIILGFSYYYLYRWNIERKIEKYKRKGLSYEEQLEIAKKSGGDKITIGVVIMFIAEIALALLLNVGMNWVLGIVHPSIY